jgi:DNA repair protein SbcC/Rad50
MNPTRIAGRNVATFEEFDIEIPTGTVAIVGSNGCGKSTLLNAIDISLFADRGELPTLLTAAENDLELQLYFEHAGERYRVRRQLRRGKSPLLDLEREGADESPTGWESLSLATVSATQERLNEILGLSRKTFRASSFLAQGDGAAFSEADVASRMRVLVEICGLELWDDSRDSKPATAKSLLGLARVELRTCENALTVARAAIEGDGALVTRKPEVVEQVAQVTASLATAKEAVTTAETDLEEAQRAHSAAAVLNEAVKTCEAEHRAAVANHEEAKERFAEAEQAGHTLADRLVELAEVSRDADKVAQLEATVDELRAAATKRTEAIAKQTELSREADQRELARDRMVAQALVLNEQANTARAAAARLETDIEHAGTCDRCQQTLGAEAAAHAATSYRAEAADFDHRAHELDDANELELAAIVGLREQAAAIEIPTVEDGTTVELQLRAARSAAERRASLGEQVAQLTEKSERKPALEEALRLAASTVDEKDRVLAEARAKTSNLDELTAKVERWRLALNEARRLVDERTRELTRAETDLERIVEAETKVAERRTEIAGLQNQVDVLKLAERAYGRDGIPALIVENAAIPQLEKEANSLLEMMPTVDGVTFNVELRTQREKKDGALKDTLDIVIYDGQDERPYESFSGGEQARINICLRIALARLLANRRGAESRLLAVDEIEYLDEAGQQQLVDVVQSVAGDFDRVLMVSHSPNIRDAFDTTIRAVKTDRRSVVAGALEAVAA